MKVIRYHNKKAKGPILFYFRILRLYLHGLLNGLIRSIFLWVHIILKEGLFYGIFAYMLKKKETLDETLMAWKKYRGNQCKLVVISKILSKFWVNKDFGSVANWSNYLCTYPSGMFGHLG